MVTTHLVFFSFLEGASVSAAPAPVVTDLLGGLGNLDWLRKNAPRKRKRPFTESEFQIEQDRIAALATNLALASIPLSAVSDSGVMGDPEIEDDDLLLQAAILRILH